MIPKKVAEGEGFEPSVRALLVRSFSKRLVSATHPSLLLTFSYNKTTDDVTLVTHKIKYDFIFSVPIMLQTL